MKTTSRIIMTTIENPFTQDVLDVYYQVRRTKSSVDNESNYDIIEIVDITDQELNSIQKHCDEKLLIYLNRRLLENIANEFESQIDDF